MKKHFYWVFFFKNQKRAFFGGKNKIVLKLKFQICISAFVLYCKRKLHNNFHKKILIFKTPGIFENENFDARALSMRAPKFWIWTSKTIPDLWLIDLFCPIIKNFHTPPYCTLYSVQYMDYIKAMCFEI